MRIARVQHRGAEGMRLVLAALLSCALVAPASAPAEDRGADGRFEKRTSSHFVLYQDVDIDQTSGLRGSHRFEQQVLAALEAAYRDADRYLGLRPDRPITVVVYDPDVFDASFAGLFRFPAAGFYGGRVHVRGDTVVGERLLRVLRHELVHAAFDAEAPSLAVPAWLNEGAAEWFAARVAGKRRLSASEQSQLARAARDGRLFSLQALSLPSFAALGPEGARLAYLQSYAFVEYLARSRTERMLRELIARYLRTGDLERAVRRSLRADLATLSRRHRAELGAGEQR